jgi:hypothetical protein
MHPDYQGHPDYITYNQLVKPDKLISGYLLICLIKQIVTPDATLIYVLPPSGRHRILLANPTADNRQQLFIAHRFIFRQQPRIVAR